MKKLFNFIKCSQCSHRGKFNKWKIVSKDFWPEAGQANIFQKRECTHCGYAQFDNISLNSFGK